MKKDDSRIRYCVQHENHARVVFSALCSLMEHQSLVDLAIRCGNNTIHAHKCILAANSPYFREQLEKNVFTEQVVVTGIDFSVMKAVVEFMYCGETQVLEDHLKQLAAVAKLFRIRGLPGVAPDHIEADNASFLIPPPIFLSKKPIYSSTYGYIPYATPPNSTANTNPTTSPVLHPTMPISTNNIHTSNLTASVVTNQQPGIIEHIQDNVNVYNLVNNDSVAYNRRMKRRCVRNEAEIACAKEAAASRLALETIQKELATTTFNLVDDHAAKAVNPVQPYVNNNYDLRQQRNLSSISVGSGGVGIADSDKIVKLSSPETAAEKIKHMFGHELPSNVEIMFKTSDGNFVNVTDEMLQAITKEALQFQVIDENGQASEIQFLKHDDKSKAPSMVQRESQSLQVEPSTTTTCSNRTDFVFLNPQLTTSVHERVMHIADVFHQVTNQQSIDSKLINCDNKQESKSPSKVLIDESSSSAIVHIMNNSDLFSNIEILSKNTTPPESNKKVLPESDRDVMFVEGIGNVVCSETVRKEDDVFFEVNPTYYGSGDNFRTSSASTTQQKFLKSNCEVQDMVISPKKPMVKSIPNISLASNFEIGDCNLREKTGLKPISDM